VEPATTKDAVEMARILAGAAHWISTLLQDRLCAAEEEVR